MSSSDSLMHDFLIKNLPSEKHSFWFTAPCSSSFSQKVFCVGTKQLTASWTTDWRWKLSPCLQTRKSASNVWATHQHTKTLKCMYIGTCGNTGACCVLLSPQLYFTVHHRAPQLAMSVITTFRVIWDQPSDQNAMDCAELLSCCSMTALGDILHTSILFQWAHTSYQCVVSVATYFIPVCCYSGHILHTTALLQWPHVHTRVLFQWPHTSY